MRVGIPSRRGGMTRGWRDALLGTAAGLVALAAITVVLGTALTTMIPLHLFQVGVGTLLLLFGLRWLRKAILRFAGIMALHDEELIYQREVAALRAQGVAQTGMDWVGFTVTCKSVLLEGLEVVFVILTLGAHGTAAFHAALWGALAGLTVTGVLSALASQATVQAYAGPVLLVWTCLLVVSNLYAAARHAIRLAESPAVQKGTC